jgi:NAD(P)-dependent dehydrogenase (short-subunit alcohol dehydrogenase family)
VTGKTALVTGSTSGIGRACAGMLAEEGAQVMVTGRRAELGETVVSEILAKGGRAAYHRADLSEEDDARDLVEATVRAYGAIDIVVNNAGLANLSHLGDGSVEVSDPSVWDIAYRVNVRSVMLVTKYAIPHLAASGHGSIINFASILARRANGWNAYYTAKGAIVSLSRSMAVALAPQKIRVNCISAGHVIVERNEEMWQTQPDYLADTLRKMLTWSGRPREVR